eukprot:TRINITY_DN25292_c0_g1_i4.p1 TRINITY_DN25292_c0_g1~~TRINITY_DN25292_c0_g1_i4.p1  ORF type:complete len:554 (-),score=91.92 TRINITY_DN25292_c0_g1_i4:1957-3525(-)
MKPRGYLLQPTELSVRHLEQPLPDLEEKQYSQAVRSSTQEAREQSKQESGQKASKVDGSENGSQQHVARPRIRKRAGPIPRSKDVGAGWADLLTEVASSARRVRAAKGGHIGSTQGAAAVDRQQVPGGEAAGYSDATKAPTSRSNARDEAAALAVVRSSTPRSARSPAVSGGDLAATSASPAVPSSHDSARDTGPGPQRRLRLHSGEDPASSDPQTDVDDNEVTNGKEEGAEARDIWRSYRIDGSRVPDSVLSSLWSHAVDPKHCADDVTPLEKVPRLTVTNREVQQLPPVHGVQHWRQVNHRRKELLKAKQEAEHYPSLDEMLVKMFGIRPPPKLAMDSGPASGKVKHSRSRVGDDLDQVERLLSDGEVNSIVRKEMMAERFPADGSKSPKHGVEFIGVLEKGRRGAFDEGQPWHRGGVATALAEVQDGKAQKQKNASPLQACLEAIKATIVEDEENLKKTRKNVKAGATSTSSTSNANIGGGGTSASAGAGCKDGISPEEEEEVRQMYKLITVGQQVMRQ